MSFNNTEWIKTKQDFIQFLDNLIVDYQQNQWENNNLEDFLTAMESWVEDAEGYYQNINAPQILQTPSWRLFADILMASTLYE